MGNPSALRLRAAVRGMSGDIEAMARYAGQSVGVVREALPAGEVIRRAAHEALRVLEGIITDSSDAR